MLDFFRDELSAEAILDYLEHLPRTSAYHAALAQDEELAKQLAKEPPPPDRGPPLTEFSRDVEVLAEVRDLLANLLTVTVKAHGGRAKQIPPYRRPETALDRERRRQQYQHHRAIAARVLPNRRPHAT